MRADDVRPFHVALREAIERRDLPLERISAHLRARGHAISIGTLSYWQSGRSLPSRSTSLRALGSLESVLGVERGHLARRLPAAPSDGHAADPPLPLADIETQVAFLDEILNEMGRTADDTMRIVSAHWRSFNDEFGSVRYGLIREILQARTSTDAYLTSAWHPVAGQDVLITPLLGCAVRRMIARRQYSVCVTELAVPALPTGGLHTVEYEISYPTLGDRVPFDRAVSLLPARVREMVVEVNFPPDALPGAAYVVEGGPGGENLRRTRLPRVHPTLTVARLPCGPGSIGIEWDPPER